MIRIDALWLATTPIDMRMGTERMLGTGGANMTTSMTLTKQQFDALMLGLN
jgi:hypothetical protein